MDVYISGLYSGPNPSAGVGIARSLRMAYPEARLIGVDYLNRSSGIHSPDFDDVWVQPPWNGIDLDEYARQIRGLLDEGAIWISSLDLEIWWLSRALPDHPRLLAPPWTSLQRTRKPAVEGFSALPFRIAPFLSTRSPDWDLHSFCRRHGWRIWLKGPYYEATPVMNWPEVQKASAGFRETWGTSELFLQASVTGYEESFAFSSYRGTLLDAVHMQKRDITVEGKTWGGQVNRLPEGLEAALRDVLHALRWTGGGELETVRDNADGYWLLECNPRFPAWIHGATLCGRNLPGALVEAATENAARRTDAQSHQFARIVLEMPVRERFPLPPLPEPKSGAVRSAGKYPSGMTSLAARLGDGRDPTEGDPIGNPAAPPVIPDLLAGDLAPVTPGDVPTPAWVYLAATAEEQFANAAALADRASLPGCPVRIAYSIKTNPDERFLSLARSKGFLAEAISKLEVNKALACGFHRDEIILNGPGKWWPQAVPLEEPIRAIFCDSPEELERIARGLNNGGPPPAAMIGVRLRAPHIESRFGASVWSPPEFARLAELVRRIPEAIPLGCHYHFPSSALGVEQWWSLYHSVLRWAHALELSSGRPVRSLDVGGGWFPDDFFTDFAERLAAAVSSAKRILNHLDHVVIEPGKALVQPAMALAVRVLEVRRDAARADVRAAVVDGSLAEVPLSHLYPHRVLVRDAWTGRWNPLGKGHGTILGRICMEEDVLALGVKLPRTLRAGDIMTICDVGAYDRSMAYEFGRG